MLSGMEQGEHGLFHHSHARLGDMQGYQCTFGTKTSKKGALDKNLRKQNCK
jgi:hypothetical protein